MKSVIILQARLDSSRLPRKVLLPLAGRACILHILDRLSCSREVDEVVVAIPEQEIGKELAQLVQNAGFRVIGGPDHDVLSRYIISTYETGAEIIVRATGDNPLVEPSIIDQQITFLKQNPEFEYVFTRRLPLGISTETLSRKTLEKLDYLARIPLHREHVTYYLVEHPEPFNIHFLEAPAELEKPQLRLTMDTEEDYRLIDEIYRELYTGEGIIPLDKVLSFLEERSDLTNLNSHVVQVPPHIEQVLASVESL